MLLLQTTTLLLVLSSLLGGASSHEESFFATKAKLDISWVVTGETSLLSVKDLNSFSYLVAPYLQQLLLQQKVNDDLKIMDVTMQVTDHTIVEDSISSKKQLQVQTEVTTWYLNHEPVENFSVTLDEALLRSDGLATVLQDVALVQPEATEFLVVVSTIRQDTEVLYSLPDPLTNTANSAADKGLIAACIFLVLALVFVSSVLVWIAGGYPILLQKGEHFVQILSSSFLCCCFHGKNYKDNDYDNDAATTASGILGARPSYDEADRGRDSTTTNENDMPAGFTPNRGVFREQDCDDSQILTPISTNTDYSTTSSRIVPLGIAPANRQQLKRLTQRHTTPEKNNSYIPNHQLTYT